MLIRLLKANDLIGCGGDPQPMRLQRCASVHVPLHPLLMPVVDYRGMHNGACVGVCIGCI